MAPIRRYLRITRHSVLEVRIYLDRPSDAEAWLLRRDNPALPRVIQAVRPLVLPKLREENENFKSRNKGKGKKKGVKDVVAQDDFEVSIFLTELSTRHSLMIKQKVFKDKPPIRSNSGKLTGWLTSGNSEQPTMVEENSTEPIIIREEEEGSINLADIPELDKPADQGYESERRKRRRGDNRENPITELDDSDDSFQFEAAPSKKRSKRGEGDVMEDVGGERNDQDGGKKKLALNTSYEGFSIYGRVLCLVVKRKQRRQQTTGTGKGPTSSEQMLENWVSTQAVLEQEEIDDDEDNG